MIGFSAWTGKATEETMKPALAIVAAIILPGGLPLLALVLWRRHQQARSAFVLATRPAHG